MVAAAGAGGAGDGERDAGGFVGGVGVLDGGDRHRLRRVVVLGREGERAADGYRAGVAARRRYRDVAGGRRAQADGERASAAPLGQREAGRTKRQALGMSGSGRQQQGECDDGRQEKSRLAARGSRLAARGSRLAARGSRLAARGSRLAARGSIMPEHELRPFVKGEACVQALLRRFIITPLLIRPPIPPQAAARRRRRPHPVLRQP